jgi:hypothetical protein
VAVTVAALNHCGNGVVRTTPWGWHRDASLGGGADSALHNDFPDLALRVQVVALCGGVRVGRCE